jgi:outer membrane protein assembly factor BamD
VIVDQIDLQPRIGGIAGIGIAAHQFAQRVQSPMRFRTVVDKYQTTSHTPEALMRLTETYLALGVR